jgi:hypothetical protein
MKEIKKGEKGGQYYSIDKPPYVLPLFFLFFIFSK